MGLPQEVLDPAGSAVQILQWETYLSTFQAES